METSVEKVKGNCILRTYQDQFSTFVNINFCKLFWVYILTSFFDYVLGINNQEPLSPEMRERKNKKVFCVNGEILDVPFGT